MGALGRGDRQYAFRRRSYEIAAQDQVGASGLDADGGDIFDPPSELEVRDYRPILLGQADHVDHAAALVLDVSGHSEDVPDRDHAGTTDTGDQDGPGLIEGRELR